jgi:GTPase SAR1 family protein
MEMLIPFHQFGGAASGVVPHLLIVGPAGIGKTTLLHAMAREWHQQHDEVIVLDLDAPRGGYPYRVIGSGGDGERVGSAVAALHRLLEKRENARFRGERVAPPVRCLVNDVHEIAQVHPEAWNDLVGRILRRGHKLNVLLAVVTYASKVSEVVPAPRDDLAEMQRIELAWEREQRVARLNGQTYTLPITS